MDDFIIFLDDMESHSADLRRVLSRLMAASLTLRGSKCFFGRETVNHLGFKYTSGGVSPAEEKYQTLLDWPTPTTVKEVQSFLGLANFYRQFIPKFAHIAAPLHELMGNTGTFTWEEKQQEAFKTLKKALISPPILDYPRQSDKFILTTDASYTGLGAVLSMNRGTVVKYASCTLSAPEKNYVTIEKECLVIVWVIDKFRHYLAEAQFTLETDHKPLLWLESAKRSRAHSQWLERWSLELRAYDFDMVYKSGPTNLNADALSRKPIGLVGLCPPLEASVIAHAQEDPVLRKVAEQLEVNAPCPTSREWFTFPLKRYKQIWSQLTLEDSMICCRLKSPTMEQEKLVIVTPKSLKKSFLCNAHDEAGH